MERHQGVWDEFVRFEEPDNDRVGSNILPISYRLEHVRRPPHKRCASPSGKAPIDPHRSEGNRGLLLGERTCGV